MGNLRGGGSAATAAASLTAPPICNPGPIRLIVSPLPRPSGLSVSSTTLMAGKPNCLSSIFLEMTMRGWPGACRTGRPQHRPDLEGYGPSGIGDQALGGAGRRT